MYSILMDVFLSTILKKKFILTQAIGRQNANMITTGWLQAIYGSLNGSLQLKSTILAKKTHLIKSSLSIVVLMFLTN